MAVDITIPEMGESVRTGVVARWVAAEGDIVKRDQIVMELETDKITAEISAPAAGRLKHMVKVGDTVPVGAVVAKIEEGVESAAPASDLKPAPVAAAPIAKAATVPQPAAPQASNGQHAESGVRATPLAEKIAKEQGIDLSKIQGTGPGGKIREQDVTGFAQSRAAVGTAIAPTPVSPRPAAAPVAGARPGTRRERVTPLRNRIAQRLVEAQHTAAMLTTYNEVDMTNVMALRTRYKEEFEKKHGIGLGFMSFFVKAACQALRGSPIVNAYLVQGQDGAMEVEYHDHIDISVAVSTPKGLTVPILRNVQNMSFAQVESAIKDVATRARDGKLTLDEIQGGTFTVTNGGVFGSMWSTPILNAPQTAILGMHAVKNRAVEHPEKPGELALRPMMYLAMSYDHRLLDGQESVKFLVNIKNAIERPERLMLEL
ncbi:MAG: 2-oxoglutarate dehydrogenase complex dihydrolipoyllysine-residue succinyltransferase [Phycisphaerales bacterium]|nr:2-oxoglutarate dehydrogenase complex dihydrolipoyllysine-residue succinyltransferase [Phycisphaerales bacterium]